MEQADITDYPPNDDALLAHFYAVSEDVAAEVVAQCCERYEIESLGEHPEELIRTGLGFVTKMLATAIRFGAVGIIGDQAEWAKARLPESGVPREMIVRTMGWYREGLRKRLTKCAGDVVLPYVDRLLQGLRETHACGN